MDQNKIINFARVLSRNTLIGKLKNLYVNQMRSSYRKNRGLFLGKDGVEIGGPSPIFTENGSIPTYNDANSIDNVNWSSDTFWSKHKNGGAFTIHEGKRLGKEWVIDSTEFTKDFHERYDFLQCSHVLEHIAGTVKALLSWRSVLKVNGTAIILVPDKRRTYDVDRPYTTLEHFIEDFNNNIGENDETHFEEIIKLHRLSVDTSDNINIKSSEDWRDRVLDNANSRIIHQHVFKMEVLSELLDLCGFKVIASERFVPHHIAIIASKTRNKPEILENSK